MFGKTELDYAFEVVQVLLNDSQKLIDRENLSFEALCVAHKKDNGDWDISPDNARKHFSILHQIYIE